MRRNRETDDSHKGTLFTFLDVLICTMGLLILLLVAIARQARLQAQEVAEATRPKVPASRYEAELVQLRIDALRTDRETADAELLKQRSVLQQIEARYRELREQLSELEAARTNLERLMAGDNTSPHRAELARLQSRILLLKNQLSEARARGAEQQTSFAIVPYQGPNGTRRRPIYIECRADKLVLQPEDIEFNEDDFAGTLGPGNPLAAGLRAAVDYANRNRRTPEGDQGEPYPLLLIRPDGINAYYAARSALRSWGADFGYEFIDGDWKLDYGRPDPQLANVERLAVKDARELQQQLAAGDSGGSGGYGGKPFRGKYRVGANGGLERIDGGEAERPTFRANPAGGGLVQERGPRSSGNSRNPGGASRPGFGQFAQGGGDRNKTGEGSKPAGGTKPGETLASGAPGNGSSASGSPSSKVGDGGESGSAGPKLRAANGGGDGTPGFAQAGQPANGAIATDRQPPQIVPQQMYGQHEKGESSSGGGETQSMAKQRGRDWGLPNAASGSNPITRPIRIQCYGDHLELIPDSPNAPAMKRIPFGPRTSDSVDALVAAIWEHIDAWGIAGKGMYWRPTLHAEASPDGQARLAELKVLLADSGLTIRDKTAERIGSRP